MTCPKLPAFSQSLFVIALLLNTSLPAADTATVRVDWDNVERVSQTTPTALAVINPLYRRSSPIHDQVFAALRDLGADYVSHLGWKPYPKLAVAALEPPANGQTSWDFRLIDPIMIDFFEATKGHSVLVNFATIPEWMFKTPKPVAYPADPDQVSWTYDQGTELRDPTLKELGDYYARLARWYTQGGFDDEFGKRHESGHKYKIDYWGVLNEIDLEHATTPEQYTERYDAIVEAVREVLPETEFVGLMLALTTRNGHYFEYFLDPKNHKPGIPLDWVSYHFYGLSLPDYPEDAHQYTFFEMADKFLDVVRYVELIRKRLSPGTRTMINELGIILSEDFAQALPGYEYKPTPDFYRNRYAAMFAYSFAELARMGIDVVTESQLLGFPSQFPSVSMIDWNSGKRNPTYWVLKLLIDNSGPGDKLLATRVEIAGQLPLLSPYVYALGFTKPDGKRKILLVNKRDRSFDVSIPGSQGGNLEVVDATTNFNPPAKTRLPQETFTLQGMGVAIVTLP